MLFVTHDLDLIGRVVDTVAVMYGGRVVETGPAELIRQSPRHPYTKALHDYTKALHDAVPADHPRDRRLATRGAGPLAPGKPGSDDAAEPGADDAAEAGEPGADPAAAGPSLVRPDSCVFASRCPRAQARCHQERPPTITEDALRSYACFYPI